MEAVYWLLGAYDGLVLMNAPDDYTVTALALSLGALGNVTTCLSRAFDETEIKAILAKM